MFLNVFEPLTVSVPAPPWFTVTLEIDTPPPLKLFELPLVRLIVPVPLIVKLVAVVVVHDPLVNVQVPDPRAIVRALELLEERVPVVTL